MQATFFVFAKKINSTKGPSILTNIYKNTVITLKENCTVSAPVIRLTWTGTGADVTPVRYNYCVIPDFRRRYWVNDWVCLTNNIWEAALQVDPLASFKTDIGNASCYVLRAASSSVANGLITDVLYPTKAKPSVSISNIGQSFATNFMQGNFIVGIINAYYSNYNVNQGAVTYYGMTMAQFGAFKNALLNDTTWLQTGNAWDLDISQSTLKALFNPFQYVTSVIWMPFSALELGMTAGRLTDIYIGWWQMASGIQGYLLENAAVDMVIGNANLEANPAAIIQQTGGGQAVDTKLLYLNYPPYSRYLVHLPPFGDFPLDAQIAGNLLANNTSYTVNFRANVDMITGQALLYSAKLEGGSWKHDGMIETSCQIGVPIQLAQITTNTGAGAVSLAQTAAQMANSVNAMNLITNPVGAVASGIAAAAAGIYNAIEATAPRLGKSESSGSVAAILSTRYIMNEHFEPVEMTPDEQGYPVCKTLTINTLSGFIKTAASDVIVEEATADELDTIRAAMDAGFYYE